MENECFFSSLHSSNIFPVHTVLTFFWSMQFKHFSGLCSSTVFWSMQLQCFYGLYSSNIFLVYTVPMFFRSTQLQYFFGLHSSNIFLVYAAPIFLRSMQFPMISSLSSFIVFLVYAIPTTFWCTPLFWLVYNKLQLVDLFVIIRYNCSRIIFLVLACNISASRRPSIFRWQFITITVQLFISLLLVYNIILPTDDSHVRAKPLSNLNAISTVVWGIKSWKHTYISFSSGNNLLKYKIKICYKNLNLFHKIWLIQIKM